MNLDCDKVGLKLFLTTVLGELNYDKWGSDSYHLSRVIVRPEKFGKYAINYPLLYSVLWKAFCLVLLFCIIPINIFLFFFVSLVYLLHRKIHVDAERLFLSFSYLLEKRVKCTDIPYNNEYWLVAPFSKGSVPGKRLTVFDVITMQIIVYSLIHSIIVPFVIVKKYGLKNFVYCLNSFEWFLVKGAINSCKNTRELYFCNHKDRWALLFDRSKIEHKILLQHGVEDCDNYFCSARLENITKVIAFNEKEARLLKRYCLNCNPNIEYFVRNLELVKSFSKKKTILIIGNSFEHSDMEENIISSFQNIDVDILLKPHPLLDKSSYYKLQKKYRFEVVADTIYPEVDLVLSYRSTLAVEYEILDKKVIYFDEFSVSEVLSFLRISLTV